jgi:Ni/Co efflux regulator RcnB
MKKLVVLMLAASALAPASALAQRTAEPPMKWEDTPKAQLALRLRAWRRAGRCP